MIFSWNYQILPLIFRYLDHEPIYFSNLHYCFQFQLQDTGPAIVPTLNFADIPDNIIEDLPDITDGIIDDNSFQEAASSPPIPPPPSSSTALAPNPPPPSIPTSSTLPPPPPPPPGMN